jgi:hypothetical protein
MMNSDFAEDVEARLASFVNVELCADGRWKAELFPYAVCLGGGDVGALPPGQIVDGSVLTSGYVVYCELDLIDEEHRGQAAQRPEFLGQWAARPRFLSHETAMNKMLWWIRENRPDLVRECEAEARAGVAYRNSRAAKSAT